MCKKVVEGNQLHYLQREIEVGVEEARFSKEGEGHDLRDNGSSDTYNADMSICDKGS